MNEQARTGRCDVLRTCGVLSAGTLGGITVARGAHAAGMERLNVALIGAGRRGTGAAAYCLDVAESVRLVAVADAFDDRARRAIGQLRRLAPARVDVPEERVFVGLDAYQRALACDVQVMIDASPPGFRPRHYRAAVEAGRHAFLEKPLCVDAAGYESLRQTSKLADQRGLKVVVDLFRRHHPGYARLVEEIRGGAVGRPRLLRCYHNDVARSGRPREPGESEMEHQLRNWPVFTWLSGGRMVEAFCHQLDAMNWILGDHPIEANGMGGRQVHGGPRFGNDYDHHFLEFAYADGTRLWAQCRKIEYCWNCHDDYVHGTEGTVNVSFAGRAKRRIDRLLKKAPVAEFENPWHYAHVVHLDAILNDRPLNEAWSGADSCFTAVLGRMATSSGQLLKWDDAAAGGDRLFPEHLPVDADPPVVPDENGSYQHAVPIPGVERP